MFPSSTKLALASLALGLLLSQRGGGGGGGGVAAMKLEGGDPMGVKAYDLYGGRNASILQYPADFNRGTFPLPVHCHNCYETSGSAFYGALAYGARSLESDVWLNPADKELYVGHDPFSLTRERTFDALTVQPLVEVLEQANRANIAQSDGDEARFFAELQRSLKTPQTFPVNGYFSLGVGSTAPIQLLVDIKTDGATTWPYVVRALEPLRKRGWLTRYEDGKLIPGPVLVIGTGNTPIDQVAPLRRRDVFFDGPLGNLSAPLVIDGTRYEWNSTLSPLASGSFSKIVGSYKGLDEPSAEVLANISRPIDEAHARGIQTRYWDSPQWPVFARNRINHLMLSAGSDWIGSDDLEHISKW
ncbi:uncharacterized protein PFL1_02084 [Pseudozyma flocculosa PF-1]|uniref:Altered inheritance of mitochondria protein 6 n=1 Tax=Pseudozyma flocculosa TaxID=84751 RepID=A0A5C3F0P0_9BASI|nr:uncharacterized protein PFL1_02084 [Pseudozyma flocculosa PF-1]EPQ30559.1 hypothetical protein PFL1_02084 [Pseudozyma flocculosa PF-1]SPO37650.1 uncharacterized protein PSFLO_03126 [Pseudozyma flocculosa]